MNGRFVMFLLPLIMLLFAIIFFLHGRVLYIHTLCHMTSRDDSSEQNTFLPEVIPVGGIYCQPWLGDLLFGQCDVRGYEFSAMSEQKLSKIMHRLAWPLAFLLSAG